MTLLTTFQQARSRGKKTVARLARRMLPSTTVRLSHVEPGLTLTVNLRRNMMFWTGGLSRFEPYTVKALRAAVREGDTVFDVGANIGFFATLLSRRVGPGGRVVAFEPEPENLAMLRANLDANGCGNVTVAACAVGSSRGTATFSLDKATGATGHIGGGPTAGELAVGTGALRLIETPVETIDHLAETQGLVPDVIKMDIEGAEIHALAGAEQTLRAHRPVVLCELSCEEGAEVVGFLHRLGYRTWDLETAREVVPGEQPFMVVALPAGSLHEGRAARVLDALGAAS